MGAAERKTARAAGNVNRDSHKREALATQPQIKQNEREVFTMVMAYICSPYRAKTEQELDNHIDYAQELTLKALKAGYAPVAPHLYLTQVTRENRPEERAAGMAAGTEILKNCGVLILGERYGISEGMRAELEAAKDKDIAVLIAEDL